MKVVCIRKPNPKTTIGKTYNIVSDIFFVDDNENRQIYVEEDFVTLEEWREQKLNKLNII